MRRAFTILVLAAWSLAAPASELAVRDSPAAYPHTCSADGAVIGVDYLRRSLPTPLGMQQIPGILIFEVGVFPRSGRKLTLPASAFDLEWKGLDRPETPADPQLVLAQLLHEEWARGTYYRHVEASAGTVDRNGRYDGVIYGRPRREPRFPSDPRPDRQDKSPEPPSPAPNAPHSEPHPDEKPDRIIPLYALETTAIDGRTAGLVYFLYRGKLKKLKKLTLHVRAGETTCRLMVREQTPPRPSSGSEGGRE